jgi:hypothetical protein
MLFKQISRWYNQCFFWKTTLWNEFLTNFLVNTFFISRYYALNDLLWQDGFLFDFLQKKFIDKWLRKFVVYSGYIYSERLLFDWVIRFYLDLIIWSGQKKNLFEFSNVGFTLTTLITLLILLFLTLTLFYLFTIC